MAEELPPDWTYLNTEGEERITVRRYSPGRIELIFLSPHTSPRRAVLNASQTFGLIRKLADALVGHPQIIQGETDD